MPDRVFCVRHFAFFAAHVVPGDEQHRTGNLEIPGLVRRTIPE
jgi:hypothetical protein